MWTVIIIIVVIIVIVSFASSQQQNKEIQNHHVSQGGLRQSFPVLTNHLENFYEMNFVNDTGRNFSYSKQLKDVNNNTGTLTIGVKYDMTNQLLIFSKYKNSFHTEFQGMDVSGINFDNVETIDKCINISLDKIKSQGILRYENDKNIITKHSEQTIFISKWAEINKELSDTNLSGTFDAYINLFFIPDSILPEKFMENVDILQNTWKGLEEGYGTKSVKGLYSIPPAFDTFFVAAYPDVYQWYQENADTNRIEVHNKLSKLSDEDAEEYFSNPEKMVQFYRALINQYKREGNKLECT